MEMVVTSGLSAPSKQTFIIIVWKWEQKCQTFGSSLEDLACLPALLGVQQHMWSTSILKSLPKKGSQGAKILLDDVKMMYRKLNVLMYFITTRSSTTNRCVHSFNFPLVNKSHSQHSVAVRCEGRHFLMYACTHVVLFSGQIPRSLIWEQD